MDEDACVYLFGLSALEFIHFLYDWKLKHIIQ